ncbi:MAG: DUF4232 domain-containing protein [Actinomycetota bacterium]|nr:DUF4232 domain-containing protein [Actinomycetota bacterium]
MLELTGCGTGSTPAEASSEPTTSATAPPPSERITAPPTTENTAPPPSENTAVPGSCRSAALSVTLGPSEGAAGTVYRSLRFTNAGSTPCVMHGFPGVSYVGGDNGSQVGPAAARDGAKGAPVTLAPAAVASAMVGMVNVGNFDAAACHPTPVKGLRVYPPGETAALFVAAPGTGCVGNPPGPQLRVRTVRARASADHQDRQAPGPGGSLHDGYRQWGDPLDS